MSTSASFCTASNFFNVAFLMILFLITFYVLGSIDPRFFARSDNEDAFSSSNIVGFAITSSFGDDDAGCTQVKCTFFLSEAETKHGPNTIFSSDDNFDSTSTISTTNSHDDDNTELGVVEEQDVENEEY